MSLTTTYIPIITPPPFHLPLNFYPPLGEDSKHGQNQKRHFYLCGDQTLSWESEWYTESFFITARRSYDSAASTGPVNPPTGIYQNVPECAAILSSQLEEASSSISSQDSVSTTTGAREVITTRSISTFTSNGRTFASTLTRTITPSITPSPNSLSNSMATASTQTLSPSSTSDIVATSPASAQTDPSSINTCAGGWDWQDWGVVAGLGSGVIVGGILWLIWWILRGRIPGIYAPRTWAVPPESRPSKWTILTFLLPFLHLPTNTSSEGAVSLQVSFTALKIAALISLLSLTAVLPMILAEVPCLSETSPPNSLGGRLGTLTDLSLLRLLNALDPSPDSAATSNTLRIMFSTSPKIDARSLSSTIAPAISSARVRLIIILVILAVLACGGGLFTIARSYAALIRRKKNFQEKICQGMEMVFIPSQHAKGFKGMSEEGVRRCFKEWSKRIKPEDEETEVDVMGVFAIPDTTVLKTKVEERDEILTELEVAEVNYISSFKLTQTSSSGNMLEAVDWKEAQPNSQSTKNSSPTRPTPPDDFLAPKGFYRISTATRPDSSEKLNVPLPLDLAEAPADSRFKEINRDSAMYGGRFDIGQRIKLDEEGNWVPDPSPLSEQPSSLITTPESSQENPLAGVGRSSSDPPHSGEAVAGSSSTPFITSPTSPGRPVSPISPQSPDELRAGTRIPTRSSHRVSREGTTPLAGHYAAIREYRAKLKELNVEIDKLQKQKFAEVASVDSMVKGWIVVGKGVRWLPSAEPIEGYTREDVLWQNAGRYSKRHEEIFWLKILGLGLVIGIIMVPILALTVGTAPGFANHLGLTKPLARSDGFGSGVVEGLVPAVALSLVVGVAIMLSNRFAKNVRCISRSRQKAIAYKAAFYLLLSVTVLCTLLITSLEYAVQSFAINVQESRTVGDGAVFSTWFVFVLLLNLAIILPALYLLRGKRLFRYFKQKRKAVTPRQKYRLHCPSSYEPVMGMVPCLLAVFYASTPLFIFPLLALPILVLLYLSFIANRYMIEHVFIDTSAAYGSILFALWTIRRFGWTLAFQPFLYGLILLSRNEWAIGGVSIGVGIMVVILSERLTILRNREPSKEDLNPNAKRGLEEIQNIMTGKSNSSNQVEVSNGRTTRSSRQSDLSLLNRITALLPGSNSRLPDGFPLPLPTERVNDLLQAERASRLKPHLNQDKEESQQKYFTENPNAAEGLIYPLEMLYPPPVIWLPNDVNGISQGELVELGRYHNLVAILDPSLEQDSPSRRKGKEREKIGKGGGEGEGEVQSPLLVLDK